LSIDAIREKEEIEEECRGQKRFLLTKFAQNGRKVLKDGI